MQNDLILKRTQQWVEQFVVGQSLCPFAKPHVQNDRVRYVLCDSDQLEELLEMLLSELRYLNAVNPSEVETTILIHPNLLTDFVDYNDFSDVTDEMLENLALDGIIQIATFHPDYQFADTNLDDAENFTNRSPFPMLHLLREESVEAAVQSHPNIESVPHRNIALMQQMGSERLKKMLHDYRTEN